MNIEKREVRQAWVNPTQGHRRNRGVKRLGDASGRRYGAFRSWKGGNLIEPGVDVANSNEQEIIAAYRVQGLSRRDAEVYAAVLMNPDPRFPIDAR